MPQSKGVKNEQTRLRMKKMRNKKGVTTDSVTKQGVTGEGVTSPNVGGVQHNPQEMVPASYVEGLNGRMYEALPERPRYLELSDGQVLDRLNQPEGHASGDFMQRMQRCNESSYNYKPNESSKERVKAMVKEATR